MLFAFFIHRASNPAAMLYLCMVGCGCGIALFVYGFRLLQRRRLILDTPFSKIRSASLGMVEISGLATGPYNMLAPITGHPCYYYRTIVWEWKQGRKNKQWVKVAGECRHLPFFIDDNTGNMLVDPSGADLDLHRDFEQEFCDSFFTSKEPAPESVRTFLARHGIITDNKIKVEEFCIKPKNALFVLGTLSENPGLEVTPQPLGEEVQSYSVNVGKFSLTLRPASFSSISADHAMTLTTEAVAVGADASPNRVVRLSSESAPSNAAEMTQQEKIAAALIRAGISNPAAWSAAGLPSSSASPVEVLDEAGTATGASNFDPHPPVVLMKGDNDKTFLISWRSQQELARALAWKCTLMIWGGPALAVFSLYLLLSVTKFAR